MTRDLDAKATRWLARRAFDAGALDPITWEFLHDHPQRAEEVAEFTEWLSESCSALHVQCYT